MVSMRNCVCSKVYINVGGLEDSAGCERDLGKTNFSCTAWRHWGYRLAALRLPPSGSSVAE